MDILWKAEERLEMCVTETKQSKQMGPIKIRQQYKPGGVTLKQPTIEGRCALSWLVVQAGGVKTTTTSTRYTCICMYIPGQDTPNQHMYVYTTQNNTTGPATRNIHIRAYLYMANELS